MSRRPRRNPLTGIQGQGGKKLQLMAMRRWQGKPSNLMSNPNQITDWKNQYSAVQAMCLAVTNEQTRRSTSNPARQYR